MDGAGLPSNAYKPEGTEQGVSPVSDGPGAAKPEELVAAEPVKTGEAPIEPAPISNGVAETPTSSESVAPSLDKVTASDATNPAKVGATVETQNKSDIPAPQETPPEPSRPVDSIGQAPVRPPDPVGASGEADAQKLEEHVAGGQTEEPTDQGLPATEPPITPPLGSEASAPMNVDSNSGDVISEQKDLATQPGLPPRVTPELDGSQGKQSVEDWTVKPEMTPRAEKIDKELDRAQDAIDAVRKMAREGSGEPNPEQSKLA